VATPDGAALIISRNSAQVLTGFTVKLTVKLCVIFVPDTVTVAVCVPAERFIFGTTVNVFVPLTPILGIDVLLRLKLDAFVPDSATVSSPVVWLPVFDTVTVWGVNAP
jgi:hypothetical protein